MNLGTPQIGRQLQTDPGTAVIAPGCPINDRALRMVSGIIRAVTIDLHSCCIRVPLILGAGHLPKWVPA